MASKDRAGLVPAFTPGASAIPGRGGTIPARDYVEEARLLDPAIYAGDSVPDPTATPDPVNDGAWKFEDEAYEPPIGKR
jgi:hypothetical protein